MLMRSSFTVVIACLLLLLPMHDQAQNLVKFRVSRPVCVLTFLQTAAGDGHMSRTLYATIWSRAKGDSSRLATLANEYRSLELSHTYPVEGYPESRPRPRTTMDLITIAAVQSGSIKEFLDRTIGILPNETWLRLASVIQNADPLYDRLIGSGAEKGLQEQLAALNSYDSRLDDIFSRLAHFYQSTWTKDIPFTVAIYPVPGSRGNTTATPHSNSLVMAVLTEERNPDMCVGVAVHEICHVLYGEQPRALQAQIDKWFAASNDPNSAYACNYIDEALATACGNAWAYEQLSGKTDTGEWYNDDYINKYAHAIYPLVKEYMQTAKPLDSIFVVKAIALFSERFPSAYKSYSNLMNRVNLYTDASGGTEFGSINNMVNRYFRVTSSYGSYPIAEAMNQLDQATGTQFFIIHANHAANLKLLAARFPQLKNVSPTQEAVISFFDKQKRPVIVINVKNEKRIDDALKLMVLQKEMSDEFKVSVLN